MDFSFILTAVIVIAAVAVILIVVKRVFAIVALLLLLFTVLLIVTGYFVYRDFQDFQTHANSSMLFLLEKDARLLAGFWTDGTGNTALHAVDESALQTIKASLDAGKYDEVLLPHYKLFRVQEKAFDQIQASQFEFATDKFAKEDFFSILEATNPSKTYADILISRGRYTENQRQNLEASFNMGMGSSQSRATLFGILFSQATKENKLFLYEQMKKGTIQVYPETVMFKAVKTVPITFLENMLTKAKVVTDKLRGTGA